MDSKFINQQTIDYLKAKQGNTFQQQLDNIRNRLNLEVDEFDTTITENNEDLLKRVGTLSMEITNLQTSLIDIRMLASEDIEDQIRIHTHFRTEIKELQKTNKKLTVAILAISLGVVGCLIKLLI